MQYMHIFFREKLKGAYKAIPFIDLEHRYWPTSNRTIVPTIVTKV